ncbi:hypothetical protein PT974_01281 [Cladobotryum mycophilum]|uniref:Uncharacterized protein n=1 Tax=Cladobotryum mycophilum TaxID=491253 RepID=A0ABR0T462_9HYPO
MASATPLSQAFNMLLSTPHDDINPRKTRWNPNFILCYLFIYLPFATLVTHIEHIPIGAALGIDMMVFLYSWNSSVSARKVWKDFRAIWKKKLVDLGVDQHTEKFFLTLESRDYLTADKLIKELRSADCRLVDTAELLSDIKEEMVQRELLGGK